MLMRMGNITFSKDFVNTIREAGFTPTRKNHFNASAICINHGNGRPFTIGKNVKTFISINNPNYISTVSDKKKSYKLLEKFYPKTFFNARDVNIYPVVAKLTNGHHGYGLAYINNKKDLERHKGNAHLFQEKVDCRHEFRFNVLDNEVFQVSHREKLSDFTDNGGLQFKYMSLKAHGSNMVSKQLQKFVSGVMDTMNKRVGNGLASYCIDVMKGKNGKYYLSELNSGYGIGQHTCKKLVECLEKKYDNGELDKYRL